MDLKDFDIDDDPDSLDIIPLFFKEVFRVLTSKLGELSAAFILHLRVNSFPA